MDKNIEREILYVDEILAAEKYRRTFKNEVRILNSFIINNHHLFQIEKSGKLYIKKSVLGGCLPKASLGILVRFV